MKQFIKKIGKKTALVVVSAFVAGTGATMAAFAAIPHSTTGMIAGCYTNSSGALRVIDAQSNGSCNGDETALSWSTGTSDRNTALMRLEIDPNDDTSYVLNHERSRNVYDVKAVEYEGTRYLCIKVAFHPEFKIANGDVIGIGGGTSIDLRIPAPNSDVLEGLEMVCGDGYNVYGFLNGPLSNGQTVFFSN